jgi:hypothetical protein
LGRSNIIRTYFMFSVDWLPPNQKYPKYTKRFRGVCKWFSEDEGMSCTTNALTQENYIVLDLGSFTTFENTWPE